MSKITKIEQCKRNKERVNIYIDEEFAFAIYMELVYRFGLKVNDEVDRDKLIEIAEIENLSKCKDSALKTIERSYKTEKEIRDKLLSKEFDETTVEKTISFLKEYTFIDDLKFTKMYVKDRIRNQGRNKIKYALTQKGVNKYLIDEVFESLNKDEEEERAFLICEKKYLSICKREDDDFKIKNKLIRYMLGRGYEYDMARNIVSKIYLEYKGD